MSVFEVRVERDAHVIVSGELDMASSPQFTSVIESLSCTPAQEVVVDLSGVSFLDASGVAALCLAQAKLDANGTVLVLGAISRQVGKVFQIIGLENAFVRDLEGADGQ